MTAVDVAIIGGGFTGALVAWHLARQAPDAEIAVIEPRERLGAGLAYSTADPSHRINVPASRMTMRTDIRDDLHRWLEAGAVQLSEGTAGPDGALFPQRGIVADYVSDALRQDLTAGRIRHLRGHAVTLARAAPAFRVTLQDGSVVTTGQVVIATSHPPPALPRHLAALRHDARLIADPSDARAITAAAGTRRVLVLGNGLTSADVIASLDRQGFRGAILALSRRGLRSRGHAFGCRESRTDFATNPAATALGLLRRERAAVRVDTAAGLPWQAALDNVRRDGAAIWSALPLRERCRLVRRLRVWWDVHRFRIAPQVEEVLDRLIASGNLRIRAGRLDGIRPEEAGLIVSWASCGHGARKEIFDRVYPDDRVCA
ncbi:FAD/NAD(P)-binding protein [Paracoccus benzoatiresistens]|uniref:FAD/NAD(P)-binding protein n=1 Tax=Paracoccus benzoatiresistens TaxID=2997341 RepID=A0ABT4J7Z6_9RHOB|nr:FAD/NAD(P)-binding protein [Paracoccus sp. EF6]MCZ0963250.1 FAD/NAD(P)-binding protein [Paracoccus sp. EF6]